MPLTETQRKFIETYVLQRPLRPPAQPEGHDQAGTAAPVGDLLAIWRAAKESTDGGIAALQAKLRASGHPDLERVAEMGLNGVTEGNQVAMVRCLMEFNAASPEKRLDAKAKLLGQVETYRAFLAKNRTVDLIEDNPFGVKVAVRAPLNGALDDISRALSAVG